MFQNDVYKRFNIMLICVRISGIHFFNISIYSIFNKRYRLYTDIKSDKIYNC